MITDEIIMEIENLGSLSSDYKQLMAYSNGIKLEECTIFDTFWDDNKGFTFGEFFSWQEVVWNNKSFYDVRKEYNLSMQIPSVLYIASTVEDKGILLGTAGASYGKIYLFEPTKIFEGESIIDVHFLADSLEAFLLKLEKVPS